MSALPAGTCFPSNPEMKASRDPLKKGRLDFAAVKPQRSRERTHFCSWEWTQQVRMSL